MRAVVVQSMEPINLAFVDGDEPSMTSQHGDMGEEFGEELPVGEEWESGSSTTGGLDAMADVGMVDQASDTVGACMNPGAGNSTRLLSTPEAVSPCANPIVTTSNLHASSAHEQGGVWYI
jgi:hypothetical protein